MKKEFLNYEQALALKELGFDEPCFGFYDNGDFIFWYDSRQEYESLLNCSAPTFSKAFRFFREKYDLHIGICHSVNGKFDCWTNDGQLLENGKYCDVDTYEKAELACLTKLIEIVKAV